MNNATALYQQGTTGGRKGELAERIDEQFGRAAAALATVDLGGQTPCPDWCEEAARTRIHDHYTAFVSRMGQPDRLYVNVMLGTPVPGGSRIWLYLSSDDVHLQDGEALTADEAERIGNALLAAAKSSREGR